MCSFCEGSFFSVQAYQNTSEGTWYQENIKASWKSLFGGFPDMSNWEKTLASLEPAGGIMYPTSSLGMHITGQTHAETL